VIVELGESLPRDQYHKFVNFVINSDASIVVSSAIRKDNEIFKMLAILTMGKHAWAQSY
jgi:hypothetical protein